MYLYCGKRITREEKRRRQRLRANLIGVALAAALVVAGIILGLTAGASLCRGPSISTRYPTRTTPR